MKEFSLNPFKQSIDFHTFFIPMGRNEIAINILFANSCVKEIHNTALDIYCYGTYINIHAHRRKQKKNLNFQLLWFAVSSIRFTNIVEQKTKHSFI